MARRSKFKRNLLQSIVIYCEGPSEKNYFRSLNFLNTNSSYKINFRTYTSDIKSTLIKFNKHPEGDHNFFVFDVDTIDKNTFVSLCSKFKKLNKSNSNYFVPILNNPCIEFLFLKDLDYSINIYGDCSSFKSKLKDFFDGYTEGDFKNKRNIEEFSNLMNICRKIVGTYKLETNSPEFDYDDFWSCKSYSLIYLYFDFIINL